MNFFERASASKAKEASML